MKYSIFLKTTKWKKYLLSNSKIKQLKQVLKFLQSQEQEQSKHGTVLITLTFKYFDPKN